MEPPSSIGAEGDSRRAGQGAADRPADGSRRSGARPVPRLSDRKPASRRIHRCRPMRRCGCIVDSWRWAGRAVLRARRQVARQDVHRGERRVEAGAGRVSSRNRRQRWATTCVSVSARDVAIGIGAMIKTAGRAAEGKARRAVRRCAQDTGDDMDAYERLLGDAMHGDATLFARAGRRRSGVGDRRSADRTRSRRRRYEYTPGSWGPQEAERLVADVGGWNTPAVST